MAKPKKTTTPETAAANKIKAVCKTASALETAFWAVFGAPILSLLTSNKNADSYVVGIIARAMLPSDATHVALSEIWRASVNVTGACRAKGGGFISGCRDRDGDPKKSGLPYCERKHTRVVLEQATWSAETRKAHVRKAAQALITGNTESLEVLAAYVRDNAPEAARTKVECEKPTEIVKRAQVLAERLAEAHAA